MKKQAELSLLKMTPKKRIKPIGSGRTKDYIEETKVYSIRGPISQEATVKKLAKEYLKQFEVKKWTANIKLHTKGDNKQPRVS